MSRQVVKSCQPSPIVGWNSDYVDHSRDFFLFRLVTPPLQPRVVWPYPI
jgi:hypothetical protein